MTAHVAATTPNPCIECNRKVKFARLAERAAQLGFDAVATGHHARIGRRGDRYTLERGADRAKDQSYVVHMLDQDDLARTLFPIGTLTKDDVRRQAGRARAAHGDQAGQPGRLLHHTTGGREQFLGRRIPFTPAQRRRLRRVAARHRSRRSSSSPSASARASASPAADRSATCSPSTGARRRSSSATRASCSTTRSSVDAPTWVDRPVEGDVLVQTSAHGTPHAATAELTADGRARPLARAAAPRRPRPERRPLRPRRPLRSRRRHRRADVSLPRIRSRLTDRRPECRRSAGLAAASQPR